MPLRPQLKPVRTLVVFSILALLGSIPGPALAADSSFGMGPPATPAIVAAAAAAKTPQVSGPFEPTWDSIGKNYKVPQWFIDGKFGIFMHWGLYSVPAYHNEWYEKHMYAAFVDWHAQHFGPQDQFGYKDFIPKFTCAKFNADQWAELFRKSERRSMSCPRPNTTTGSRSGTAIAALGTPSKWGPARPDRRIGGGGAETRAEVWRLEPQHRALHVHPAESGTEERPGRSPLSGLLTGRSTTTSGCSNSSNCGSPRTSS